MVSYKLHIFCQTAIMNQFILHTELKCDRTEGFLPERNGSLWSGFLPSHQAQKLMVK